MRRLYLTILMIVIAVVLLFFAGFADVVAVAFVYVLLAALSVLCASFIYFRKNDWFVPKKDELEAMYDELHLDNKLQ